MISEKDKLCPMQPYFAYDTREFRREVYQQQGISHFYTCYIEGAKTLRLVPDGCINLFFEYYQGQMEAYACGTRLEYGVEPHYHGTHVFGVRFMPGVQPKLLTVSMRELVNRKLPLGDILSRGSDWLLDMAHERDFYQLIRIFNEHYIRTQKQCVESSGKKELVCTVKKLAYDTDGRIKVREMKEQTGYTERYINKVFTEEMGFPPKTYCKIIRFQRALELLNRDADDSMTKAAAELGYYDQSQFIRDFTRCAGITPGRYRRLVRLQNYRKQALSQESSYRFSR